LAITPAQVVLEVEDDGPGFDWEACAGSPDAADWLERDGGRGLFLLRSYMDLVESVPPTANRRHRVRMLLRRT
jgi:serine/threonine-protein kinase RsbW